MPHQPPSQAMPQPLTPMSPPWHHGRPGGSAEGSHVRAYQSHGPRCSAGTFFGGRGVAPAAPAAHAAKLQQQGAWFAAELAGRQPTHESATPPTATSINQPPTNQPASIALASATNQHELAHLPTSYPELPLSSPGTCRGTAVVAESAAAFCGLRGAHDRLRAHGPTTTGGSRGCDGWKPWEMTR